MGHVKNEINAFEGQYKFLSNFFLRPLVGLDGIIYPALENAFQSFKTTDKEEREIFESITPAKAKQKGRQLDLRPDWDKLKDHFMWQLLTIKFQDRYLRVKLLDTGSLKLVEGNWWGDTYWGRCNGVGENKLGVLLMQVREELRRVLG